MRNQEVYDLVEQFRKDLGEVKETGLETKTILERVVVPRVEAHDTILLGKDNDDTGLVADHRQLKTRVGVMFSIAGVLGIPLIGVVIKTAWEWVQGISALIAQNPNP